MRTARPQKRSFDFFHTQPSTNTSPFSTPRPPRTFPTPTKRPRKSSPTLNLDSKFALTMALDENCYPGAPVTKIRADRPSHRFGAKRLRPARSNWIRQPAKKIPRSLYSDIKTIANNKVRRASLGMSKPHRRSGRPRANPFKAAFPFNFSESVSRSECSASLGCSSADIVEQNVKTNRQQQQQKRVQPCSRAGGNAGCNTRMKMDRYLKDQLGITSSTCRNRPLRN